VKPPAIHCRSPLHACFVTISALGLGTLRAQPILILNAGFESNSITPGAFVVLQPSNWVNHDPSSIINGFNNAVGVIRPSPGLEYFPAGAPEGDNAALLYLAGPETAEVGLQQTLTTTLQGGRRYRLSVMVGNIASGTSLPGSSDGFPGYRLDLLAGGVLVAADTNSIGATIPEGEFRRATLIFDSPTNHPQLGQSLGVRVVNLKQPGTPTVPNIEVDFDDVQLSVGPIPSPANLVLTLNGTIPEIAITGTTGAVYRLEYAAALPTTNWITLTNLAPGVPPAVVTDLPIGPTNSTRFYRAVAN
jgi:hypothetical protein